MEITIVVKSIFGKVTVFFIITMSLTMLEATVIESILVTVNSMMIEYHSTQQHAQHQRCTKVAYTIKH